MNKIILLLALFVLYEVNAQTRPANIEVPILVYDNSGNPESSRLLICGIDSMATDSIDSFLGEFWLFCGFGDNRGGTDCPPVDHFNAMFDIPAPPPPSTFLWGSYRDYRFGMVPYSATQVYELHYVTWNAATALYISWDFPEGVFGRLQDPFGGVILNYQMPDSGTFTHPLFMQINWVQLIITFQNVTPVELVTFSSTLLNNNVKLNWSTATETNNSGFEIQKQVGSGQPAGSNWEVIGFVPGFGTTTEPKSYSFTDKDIITGTYKYRLKQIDFDGTFTYSNEIEVEFDFTPKEFVLFQNYPNPFNPNTIIKFAIPKEAQVNISVYNLLGEKVREIKNEIMQHGNYEVEFDGSGLASGFYIYRLSAGNYSAAKKLVLMK